MINTLDSNPAADPNHRRRGFFYNGGFLWDPVLRDMLRSGGIEPTLGLPKTDNDRVIVWGHSPTAPRGEKIAQKYSTNILRIEDAFLRSLFPGRVGKEPPLGILIDDMAMHYDASQPSRLETILKTEPLDDGAKLARATAAIERIKASHLTKYAAVETTCDLDAGYVVVIDQVRDDAAVRYGRVTAAHFDEMLYYAQEEHPKARIVIKTHPETAQGARQGYFNESHVTDRVSLYDAPVSPQALFEGAIAVYTVSSQMGFEAILAGHRPVVFGCPFYAGWGLTDDRLDTPRRGRKLTRAQLFCAAMIDYPLWFDPHHRRRCELEDILNILEARARAWREDHKGWTMHGMRLWKRKRLKQFFGQYGTVRFSSDARDQNPTYWANKAPHDTANITRMEDGFLRSRGLGAELVPPLSLVTDRQGIYFDPTRQSDLETIIRDSTSLRQDQLRRAENLRDRILAKGLSKYNLGGASLDLPEGYKILVPGQVEDDASIRLGTDKIKTNLDLLKQVRHDFPQAILIYKPHPDVEAGLRNGKIPQKECKHYADVIADQADAIALLNKVDAVATMTSLMGFEALLRGKMVHTYGAPFYAGWGLTQDHGKTPARRKAHITLDGLTYACLITYPRYFDPILRLPCPPEVALTRLAQGQLNNGGLALRTLAKLQGLFASCAPLWRK